MTVQAVRAGGAAASAVARIALQVHAGAAAESGPVGGTATAAANAAGAAGGGGAAGTAVQFEILPGASQAHVEREVEGETGLVLRVGETVSEGVSEGDLCLVQTGDGAAARAGRRGWCRCGGRGVERET